MLHVITGVRYRGWLSVLVIHVALNRFGLNSKLYTLFPEHVKIKLDLNYSAKVLFF